MGDISTLVTQFATKTNWEQPDEAVVQEFQQALLPLIEHKYDKRKYIKAGQFLEKWLPHFFDIPKKATPNEYFEHDWSKVITGAENIEHLLGKENVKLILVPGPHNTHLDEALLGLALFDVLGLDVRVGARTNMFRGPGKHLRDLGSWAMAFYERGKPEEGVKAALNGRMPPKMYMAARELVDSYIEHTLLPESNLSDEISGKPSYAMPLMWMHDGRSYSGKLKKRSEGNIERLVNISDQHKEWEMYLVPIVITHQSVPEEDAFPKLLEMEQTGEKRLKPLKYQWTDYSKLLSTMIKHKGLGWLKHYPKSHVYMEIQSPIPIKHPNFVNRFDMAAKARKTYLANKVEKAITRNYLPLPEKMFSYALTKHTSMLEGNEPIDFRIISNEMVLDYKRLMRTSRKEHLTKHPDGNLDRAIQYMIADGTLKNSGGRVYVNKPDRITWQAGTVDHLMR